MESIPGYRACFECSCGAYRWQKTAVNKGENTCLGCGAPFTGASLRSYPKTRGMPSATRHQSATSWTRSSAKSWADAKGAGSKGGKGVYKGAASKGQGPLQPGPLGTISPTGTGGGSAAAGAGAQQNVIKYDRAAKDIVYRARTHYEVTKGLWGDTHPLTQAAQQSYDEANREAIERQPPARRLSGLRQELHKEMSSLSHALQRCNRIEEEMAALQQEYYAMEEAAEMRAQRTTALQLQIDEYEAAMQLPQATASGPRLGPRDHLQSTLQQIVHNSGKEIGEKAQGEVCQLIEILLQKLQVEQNTTDADMDAPDISDPDSDGDGDREPSRKVRKAQSSTQDQTAAGADDDEWQNGLGAVGKKLARRGLLGKRTAQQLAATGGKAGGKANSKGKGQAGKGKGYATYSAAVQSSSAHAAGGERPAGGALPTGTLSATGQPGAASAPVGPQPAVAGGESIDAAAYVAHQAQLRRGEGQV